jgi:hypothetical protein
MLTHQTYIVVGLFVITWTWSVLTLCFIVLTIRYFRKEDATLSLCIEVLFIMQYSSVIFISTWTWIVFTWLIIVYETSSFKNLPLNLSGCKISYFSLLFYSSIIRIITCRSHCIISFLMALLRGLNANGYYISPVFLSMTCSHSNAFPYNMIQGLSRNY